ncbi:type II secretion system F family protein [Streptomyces endophyticus]|uniref:Type II secretion system F family protein n=1 Tax=Streptomyces endophyticus TaxID=714166 RepID=A0ABU6F207_9ACTN|nr:type II secretion system F family protein [Streptomyces endophyticus]MEB8338047.1 type II secretion system F family protein [Streptomyces endophyticus]
MIAFLALSMGVGLGLWALTYWIFPLPPPLTELISRIHAVPSPPEGPGTRQQGWAERLGAPFARVLSALGLPTSSVRKDLTVIGRPVEAYLGEKAALTLAGLCLPTAVELILTIGGHPLPWAIPLGGALALAVGGFLLPDVSVTAGAEHRRAAFRHALSAYLNLIHILLAGGAGVEGALTDAAEIGHGQPFQRIRSALNTARLTRTSPWTMLGQLGDEVGVSELSELAASLSLAGTEGAKIRASLAAKAAALRSRDAAEAEGRANAATERMALPGVLMGFGFVLFVFYPALVQIEASL